MKICIQIQYLQSSFFENLVNSSKVNADENRKTVEQYNTYKENLSKFENKLNLWRFLRVLMCITIVLIPLVILKITPKIRAFREEIEEADMKTNYDFTAFREDEESTIDVLSGDYNENPFLFENKVIHTMGTETYHGYKTISWTETYHDSSGKLQRRTRTQTLHATVVKPKPYYSAGVVLNYGSQGGAELSFSRDATHLDAKSEKAIERYVKKGEKKLKRLTDKAIKENDDFQSMSNSDFEVLFDALDRTDEVQFRTLFTPLAQTNMVDFVPVYGGDGRYHNVSVPWDEYLPLEQYNNFFVASLNGGTINNPMATGNGLCIFK